MIGSSPLGPAARTTHRALMLVALALALLALVTDFLDWHEVHERANDLGDGLACAMMVDCDPGVVDDGPRLTGVVTRDSGFDHSGWPVPAVLIAIVLIAAFAAARARIAASVIAGLALLGGVVAIAALSFDLSHMFDETVSLWPEAAHAAALLVLVLVGAANLVAVPILHARAGARRRAT